MSGENHTCHQEQTSPNNALPKIMLTPNTKDIENIILWWKNTPYNTGFLLDQETIDHIEQTITNLEALKEFLTPPDPKTRDLSPPREEIYHDH